MISARFTRLELCVGGAFAALLVLSATACSSPPNAYDKPPLPAEQVATLDWVGGVWGGSRSPAVGAIDGRPMPARFLGSSTKIAPGRHTIDFGYSVYRGMFAIPAHGYVQRSLTFDASAGHLYRLRTECTALGSGNCSSWIEDITDNVAVAGTVPGWYDRDLAARSAVARNASAASESFDKLVASACGSATAEFDVALYYLAGIAPMGEIDLVSAYAWYGLAESDGHPEAAAVRRMLEGELSPEQLVAAEQVALRREACSAGPRPEPGAVPGPTSEENPT
jgi:hypothetical protein